MQVTGVQQKALTAVITFWPYLIVATLLGTLLNGSTLKKATRHASHCSHDIGV